MSEEDNGQSYEPDVIPDATVEVTTKKPRFKVKPKKKKVPEKVKTVKKPAKAKAAAKRPARDNARQVAKASGGKLNADQIRILRALNGKGRPLAMPEIKKGVGLDAEKKYSGAFLKSLHNLQESKLIRTEKDQDEKVHMYSIAEKGEKSLKAAESAFKAKT